MLKKKSIPFKLLRTKHLPIANYRRNLY